MFISFGKTIMMLVVLASGHAPNGTPSRSTLHREMHHHRTLQTMFTLPPMPGRLRRIADSIWAFCDTANGGRCIAGYVNGLGVDTISGRDILLPGSTICIKGKKQCVTADSIGWFALQRVPPIPFTITVQLTGYKTEERRINHSFAGQRINDEVIVLEKNLTAEERQHLRGDTLDRKRVVLLHGRVFDWVDTALKVAGATVCDVATGRCAQSVADGTYRLWVASGLCRMTTTAPGYDPAVDNYYCGTGEGEEEIYLKKSQKK